MGKTSEQEIVKRVYQNIKRAIVFHEFPSGERLNIESFALQWRVSTTPIREIFNRLVAEGLIESIPKVGFFMKELPESEIRDLYDFNHLLVSWAVGKLKRKNNWQGDKKNDMNAIIDQLSQAERPPAEYLVETIASLYARMAVQSCNTELRLRMLNLNDRLHYMRRCEYRFCESEKVGNAVEDMVLICRLYQDEQFKDFQVALDKIHDTSLDLLQPVLKAMKFSALENSNEFGV